jgi:hypothetical protein
MRSEPVFGAMTHVSNRLLLYQASGDGNSQITQAKYSPRAFVFW